MNNEARNAPCPCGSGEKFKHCCMDATASATERRTLSPVLRWQLPLFAILFGGLVLLIIMTNGRGSGGGGAESAATSSPTAQPSTALPAQGSSNLPPGATPEPWFYDQANNQHWHPGHAHWHSGPPPPPSQRTTSNATAQPPTAVPNTGRPPGETPEPWSYDQANDQHWHPDHGHWHPGPPPPPAQRP